MSAKRRNRKIQNKRSKSDVDPYTERYRKSSDAAKAARDAARRRGQEAVVDEVQFGIDISEPKDLIVIGTGARIRSVSLVPEGEGTGYIIFSDGEEPSSEHPEDWEKVIQGLAPGVDYHIVDKLNRGVVQPRRVGKTEAARRWHAAEEAFRAEAASDGTSSSASRGSESAEGQPSAEPSTESQGRDTPEARPYHRHFFEAEVNGLPTHVGTGDCNCALNKDHWSELGEN